MLHIAHLSHLSGYKTAEKHQNKASWIWLFSILLAVVSMFERGQKDAQYKVILISKPKLSHGLTNVSDNCVLKQ